jgi:AraC-like DNA-binding protein
MIAATILSNVKLDLLAVDQIRPTTWWRIQNVSNPYARVYVITGGEASVRHHGKRYDLRAGVMHVIPAFTRVDMYCARFFEVGYAHFTARLAGGADLFSVLDCDYQTGAGQREYDLLSRLTSLNPGGGLRDYDPFKPVAESHQPHATRVVDGDTIARHLETDGLLRQLLAPILRTASLPSIARLNDIQRFEPVLRFIDENLDRPLLLQELAAHAHLSTTYFSDLFAAAVGLRPIEYLNRRRVARAQVLLVTTDWPVKRIASSTGFGSTAYFCRAFKQHCGRTPTNYREQSGGVI